MRHPTSAALDHPPRAGWRTALAATAAALIVAGRTPPARASSAQPVRITGTGSAMGTVRELAEAHRRRSPAAAEAQFLPNLGTTGGIAAVLEGAADVAVALTAPP